MNLPMNLMNLIWMSIEHRVRGWLGVSLCALAAVPLAHAQVTPIFTNNFSQSLFDNPEYPDGSHARYGEVIVGLGDGHFAVGAPKAGTPFDPTRDLGVVREGGAVLIYDGTFQFVGNSTAQVSYLRRDYGAAMSAFPDGRFLVGAGNTAVAASGSYRYVGTVQLQGADGELLGTWLNPDGATNQNGYFGHKVAAIPPDHFAAGSLTGLGKVFVFDATNVSDPLVVITNPTPLHTDFFGYSLAALGSNRLLVGDPGDSVNGDRAGSVLMYDLEGNLLRTIHNFKNKGANFGGRPTIPGQRHLGRSHLSLEWSIADQSFRGRGLSL
jgi:hypothetical protein